MTQEIELKVPDLGDFDEVEVIEVMVAVGDNVEVEDSLVMLETDKAAMEVPASHAGKITAVNVAVGDKVKPGDVIALASGAAASEEQSAPATDDSTEAESEAPADAPAEAPAEAPADAASPAETSSQKNQAVTIVVPDLGDFDSVDVIEIEVNVGDSVDVDDSLLTLETDKASMDVPSTHAGVITKILVAVGDQVSPGSAIIEMTASGGAAATTTAAEKPPKSEPAAPAAASAKSAPAAPADSAQESSQPAVIAPPSAINEAGFSRAHASPSVRRLARELGADLVQVKGTGAKGRIVGADLKSWVKAALAGKSNVAAPAALPATPMVDFAKFGEIEVTPLTRIQKISGPRLQASWINLPHVTQFDLADITDMEAQRKALKEAAAKRGVKLTPLAFVVRAVVQALQEHPRINSSLSHDGASLVTKHYCHVGFAADTPNGLMVPVIRDADKKDIYELANDLADLSLAARDGKLKAAQMQGASFTISSLGGIGGTAFTPIVNAPEVAILGVSRSSIQPVWDGEAFAPRLMLPLSLSYDHRVVDGAEAVRFTTTLGKCLANVDRLLQAIP